jgi:hypothetical protein
MCWIVFALLAAPIAACAAYRYYFGKWPLRWNS